MLGDALQGHEPDRDDWRRFTLIEAENARLRAALTKIADMFSVQNRTGIAGLDGSLCVGDIYTVAKKALG